MIFFKTDVIHAQDSFKLVSSGLPNGTGEWQLIWQDEFNGTSIDTSKWNIEGNWDLNPNDQLDYWVNTANASVADGNLILKVDYDSVNKRYNGAGIHSNNKYEHLYGYYEARILFPTQQGQNPAFWMHSWNMPHIDSSGVDGSEIDIIEKPWIIDQFQQTLHWDGYGLYHKSSANISTFPTLSNGYHTIGLLWQPDSYKFYIDGTQTWSTQAGGVSKVPSFLWFTNAPSRWGGQVELASLPDTMKVDYVRVYDPVPKPDIISENVGLSYSYLYQTQPSGNYPDTNGLELNDNIVPSNSYMDSGWVGLTNTTNGQIKIDLHGILGNAKIDSISIDLLTNAAAGIHIPNQVLLNCGANTLSTITPSSNPPDGIHRLISSSINATCTDPSLVITNWWWTFIGEIELTGTIAEIPKSLPISTPVPSPSPSPSIFPTPSPSFTFSDLKNLLINYLNNSDSAYNPVDGKINMLDASWVIKYLE